MGGSPPSDPSSVPCGEPRLVRSARRDGTDQRHRAAHAGAGGHRARHRWQVARPRVDPAGWRSPRGRTARGARTHLRVGLAERGPCALAGPLPRGLGGGEDNHLATDPTPARRLGRGCGEAGPGSRPAQHCRWQATRSGWRLNRLQGKLLTQRQPIRRRGLRGAVPRSGRDNARDAARCFDLRWPVCLELASRARCATGRQRNRWWSTRTAA